MNPNQETQPKEGNWENIVRSLAQANSQKASSNPTENEMISRQNNDNDENIKYSEIKTDMISYLAPFTQQYYLENSLKERENLFGSLMCATKHFLVYTDTPNILKIVSLFNLKNTFDLKFHEKQVNEIAVYNEHKTSVPNPISSLFKEKKINLFASIDNDGILLVWYAAYFNEDDQIFVKNLMCTKIIETGGKEVKMKFKSPLLFLTYYEKEMSVWSLSNSHYDSIFDSIYNENNQNTNREVIPGPSKFLTHIFGNKILNAEFSQKNDLIYVCLDNNSLSLLNGERLDVIKTFQPYHGTSDNLIQVLPFMNIFKPFKLENKDSSKELSSKDFCLRDIFITVSDKMEIKVWDLSELENQERNFGCIETCKPPLSDMKNENDDTDNTEKKFIVDFDFTRNFLFILFRQNKENNLIIYHISSKFYEYNEEIFKNPPHFFDFLKEFKLQETIIYQFQVINLFEQEYKLYFHTEEKSLYAANTLNELQNEENFHSSQKHEISDTCNSKTYFAIFCLYYDYFNINLVGSESVYPIYLIEDLDKIEKNQENQNKASPENLQTEEKKENFPPQIPHFLIEMMHHNKISREDEEIKYQVASYYNPDPMPNFINRDPEFLKILEMNKLVPNHTIPQPPKVIPNPMLNAEFLKIMEMNKPYSNSPKKEENRTAIINEESQSANLKEYTPIQAINSNNPQNLNVNASNQSTNKLPTILGAKTNPINQTNNNSNIDYSNNKNQALNNKQKNQKKKPKKTKYNAPPDNDKRKNNESLEKEYKPCSPYSENVSESVKEQQIIEEISKKNAEEKFVLENEEINEAQINKKETTSNENFKDFGFFFEKISSLIENKIDRMKDELEKTIDHKLEKVMSTNTVQNEDTKNFQGNKNQMNNSPNNLNVDFTKIFSEQFEKSVTPCFEKYLIKIFEQINNTFERGQKFFIDKINVEQIKSQNIKDSLQEALKIFMQISSTLSENVNTNIKNNNKLDSEKNAQMAKMVENINEVIKKEQEIQIKIVEIEKNFQNILVNVRDLAEFVKQNKKEEEKKLLTTKENKDINYGIGSTQNILSEQQNKYYDTRSQSSQNMNQPALIPYFNNPNISFQQNPQFIPQNQQQQLPNQMFSPNIGFFNPNMNNMNQMEINKNPNLTMYSMNSPPNTSNLNAMKFAGEIPNDPQKIQEMSNMINNLSKIQVPMGYPQNPFNSFNMSENMMQQQPSNFNLQNKPMAFTGAPSNIGFNQISFPYQLTATNQNFQEPQKTNIPFQNFQYGILPFLQQNPNNNAQNQNDILINPSPSNNTGPGNQATNNITKQKTEN